MSIRLMPMVPLGSPKQVGGLVPRNLYRYLYRGMAYQPQLTGANRVQLEPMWDWAISG